MVNSRTALITSLLVGPLAVIACPRSAQKAVSARSSISAYRALCTIPIASMSSKCTGTAVVCPYWMVAAMVMRSLLGQQAGIGQERSQQVQHRPTGQVVRACGVEQPGLVHGRHAGRVHLERQDPWVRVGEQVAVRPRLSGEAVERGEPLGDGLGEPVAHGAGPRVV